MFSKSCIYAIKIMIYLRLTCGHDKIYLGVQEISEAIDSPKPFTSKILQRLSKEGLIESLRGRNGGFYLHPDQRISLAQIVTVMDGDQLMKGCVLGFAECSETKPCPLHNKLQQVRNLLQKELTNTSVEEMKDNIEAGLGFIKYNS